MNRQPAFRRIVCDDPCFAGDALYICTGVSRLPDTFIDACSTLLPPWRFEKMMNYRNASDKKLCAAAYLSVVHALKNMGIFEKMPEFGYHAEGKPYLLHHPGIYFNVSHCPDAVVCIFSGAEVGADVETVSEYDDDLAKRVCNDEEYRRIAGFSDPDEKEKKFTELWTRKESVVKCRGTGLSGDPRKILDSGSAKIRNSSFEIHSIYDREENLFISICKRKI